MASTVPAPVLDTRDADSVTAQAIASLPAELSDRSNSNPSVVIIEAVGTFFDKLIFQINSWPSAVIQKALALVGVVIDAASAATVTQTFVLSSPQASDTVIPAGTTVATSDGTISFETIADLTISAYSTLTGTVTFTGGSTAVTGSGTTFVTGSTWVGYQIRNSASNTWYTISAVGTTTALTLSTSFAEATVSAATAQVGPVSGTTSAQATTEGSDTNTGAATLITLQSSPAGVSTTTNAAAATGGAEEETNTEAIARAQTAFAARDVACSASDYAYFAVQVLGQNGRAYAKAQTNITTTTNGYVTVALLSPTWTTSSAVTALERAAVIRDLAQRTFTGSTTIDIAATINGTVVGLASSIAAVVYRKAAYDETSTKVGVAGDINTYYSPNTYPFNRALYVSDLASVIESAEEVDRVEVINGVVCCGFNYTTTADNITLTNGNTTATIANASAANMVANRTILLDATNKDAYLVTAKVVGMANTDLTLHTAFAGATPAAAPISWFNASDVTSGAWYDLPYSSLSTTTTSAPAQILVTGSV